MKKALIIGISGQDGALLAASLLSKGYDVVGTSRDADFNDFKNLKTLGIKYHVDLQSLAINDFRSVIQVLKKVVPDEVYNLAGQTSVGLSFDQPVETIESIAIGTLNILEAIRFIDKPVRFYNAGSGEVFGDTSNKPADEKMPYRPRSPYGIAKATALYEVVNYRESYGLWCCSGILFNHESPLRPKRFVTRKIISSVCRIASGSNEKLTLGNIDVERDWGWAQDYVEAIWQIMQADQPDDFIIATGQKSSLRDFLSTAFSCFDLDWREHVVIDQKLYRPSDIAKSFGNPSKVAGTIGWKAKHFMKDVVRLLVESEMTSINTKM